VGVGRQATRAADAPQAVAHFFDKLLFCLFAEDTGLLPKGLLSRLADATRSKPDDFAAALGQLFGTMASGGGMFGVERIDWFNGGLFDSAEVLTLTTPEIGLLVEVGHLDWGRIEPAIFGTLFERGLDPDQRTQLGAHYTSRDDRLSVPYSGRIRRWAEVPHERWWGTLHGIAAPEWRRQHRMGRLRRGSCGRAHPHCCERGRARVSRGPGA
jgi:hypothetical protein